MVGDDLIRGLSLGNQGTDNFIFKMQFMSGETDAGTGVRKRFPIFAVSSFGIVVIFVGNRAMVYKLCADIADIRGPVQTVANAKIINGRITKGIKVNKMIYKKVINTFEKYYTEFFIFAIAILALFCFYKLDVQYVNSWDEARHGVNAYEMIQNHDYIMHTYNYQTDYWNLKPSMSFWEIILGFKIFGYSVMGLRAMSALAYLLTGIVCALFAKRYSKEASILVILFMCINVYPLEGHLARSGDADGLYLLFFTLAMLAMLKITENHKFIYVYGVLFSLAFLTKSWHAGMIIITGFVWLICTKNFMKIKCKEWIGCFISIFMPLLLWFGWRYSKDGFAFLEEMVKVDLLARTSNANYEGHAQPLLYYFQMLFQNDTSVYRLQLYACIFGIIILLLFGWKKYGVQSEIGTGILLWFLIPLVCFSVVKMKLDWYCYPSTVPLALAAAILMGNVITLPIRDTGADGKVEQQKSYSIIISTVTSIACIIAIFNSVKYTVNHVYKEISQDSFQTFISESITRDSKYAGEKAYIYLDESAKNWNQNVLFMAEISGDFHCENGGIESFLTEQDAAVLYISAEEYEKNKALLKNVELVARNESYLLLANEK